jgi:protein-tyrosine phosphatase
MRTELYPIDGPWPGHLAIAPRPRGGDWLEDEIRAWRRSGIDVVLSLLTREEEAELGLTEEAEFSRANSIEFVSFPILDRGVPSSREVFAKQVTDLAEQLRRGKSVAVHCRQGIGRAALVAIGLLISAGVEWDEAIRRVGSARGCSVPETPDQRQWVADFGKSIAIRGCCFPGHEGVSGRESSTVLDWFRFRAALRTSRRLA